VTSMPDSAPQANGPVHSRAIAATRAIEGGAPKPTAARRATSAAPTAAATPSVLLIATDAPAIRAPAARRSVHSGAVEPETGWPGL
jgi:hypothetical protein